MGSSIWTLPGSNQWYWGMDYTGGDLYRNGHTIQCNRGVLVHYPDGTVYEPIRTKKHGQYLGKLVYCDGQVALLMMDFPKEEIHIMIFNDATGKTSPLAVLPLALADDCYNLMLKTSPLLLTRSPQRNRFYVLWPERREFVLEERESFVLLDGDRMYTENGMMSRTTGMRFLCGILRLAMFWNGCPGAFGRCQTARSGFWRERSSLRRNGVIMSRSIVAANDLNIETFG